MLSILRVAQRIKKQSVDYKPVKEKLLQSWRYKTEIAVTKRHKNHLYIYLYRFRPIPLAQFNEIFYQKKKSNALSKEKITILYLR